jgi:hypothetical protein
VGLGKVMLGSHPIIEIFVGWHVFRRCLLVGDVLRIPGGKLIFRGYLARRGHWGWRWERLVVQQQVL